MSDRDAFREARAAGKAKHHEQRLERAIRREVAEEIALALEARRVAPPDKDGRHHCVVCEVLTDVIAVAREIGSRDPA